MCFIKIHVPAATHVGDWRRVPFGALDLIAAAIESSTAFCGMVCSDVMCSYVSDATIATIGLVATFHAMMPTMWCPLDRRL